MMRVFGWMIVAVASAFATPAIEHPNMLYFEDIILPEPPPALVFSDKPLGCDAFIEMDSSMVRLPPSIDPYPVGPPATVAWCDCNQCRTFRLIFPDGTTVEYL